MVVFNKVTKYIQIIINININLISYILIKIKT